MMESNILVRQITLSLKNLLNGKSFHKITLSWFTITCRRCVVYNAIDDWLMLLYEIIVGHVAAYCAARIVINAR